MKIRVGLKNALIIDYVLMAIIPLLIIGLISFRFQRQDLLSNISKEDMRLADTVAAEVSIFLKGPLSLLRLAGKATGDTGSVKDISADVFLDNLVATNDCFESIFLLDKDGRVRHVGLPPHLVNRRGEYLGADMSKQDFYPEAHKGFGHRWSKTYISTISGEPSLTLSLPVKGGMIVGNYSLLSLGKIIDPINRSGHGYAYIVNREGRLIAHPSRANVTQQVSIANLNVVQEGLAGRFGTYRYIFKEKERQGSVVGVPETGWLVVVARTIDEVLAPVVRLERIFLGSLLMTMIAAVLNAFFSLGKLLKSFSALTNSTQQIAMGNYSFANEPILIREVDELAGHLQAMSAAVMSREITLQERNEELIMVEEELRQQLDEYQKSQDLLSETNHIMQTLFQAAPTAIVAFDQNGMVTLWNQGAERIFGWKEAEVLGRPAPMASQDGKNEFRHLQLIIEEQGIVTELELQRSRKDGTIIDISLSAAQLHDIHGDFCGIMSVSADISARKKAEKCLLEEKNKLQATISSIGDGLSIQDREYRIIFQNQALTDLLGDQLGQHCYKVYANGDQVCACCPISLSFQDGQTHTAEMLVTINGMEYCLEKTASPLRDASGEIVGAVEIVRDITNRKQVEAALQRNELYYRSLIENAFDIITVLNADGTALYQSPSVERVLGYSPNELIGRNVFELVHPEDLAGLSVIFDEVLHSSLLSTAEFRYHHKNGSWRILEGGCKRIHLDNELKVVANFRDITDRREAENEIRRLNSELEQRVEQRTAQLATANKSLEEEIRIRAQAQEEIITLNEDLQRRSADLEATNCELESFSYSVSHDLRAPLRHIEGFGRILLEDYADGLDLQGKQCVMRVCSASQRMSQLIDDLLNLSRVTRSELSCQRVDLSGMAWSVAEELRQSQPERLVTFLIADGLIARGDARLLRVLLDNLLGNAWKYTSKNESATIEFGRTFRDRIPVWFVRDNGVGFDMTYAGRLFGTFQRLHNPAEFEGTGIGLATVLRIVNRHHGKIWADARLGEGATFYFTLADSELGS